MELWLTTKTYLFKDSVSYETESNGTIILKADDILCRIEKKNAEYNLLVAEVPNSSNKIILNLSNEVYESFLKQGILNEVANRIETIH